MVNWRPEDETTTGFISSNVELGMLDYRWSQFLSPGPRLVHYRQKTKECSSAVYEVNC